jgi:glucosamine--fructose-6-phosphate aminotransferase (isomerizing)
MCGIVGYVGDRCCRDLLLKGLERLEYRGYDSAGLSLLSNGHIDSVRAVGNLQFLKDAVEQQASAGAVATAISHATTGIGHTRWATHGRVTEANAHPHFDNEDRVHIALNGIVENFATLREQLQAEGAVFTSETDAEVVAHLIARRYDGDLVEAVRRAYAELRGHYAFVAMHADEPGVLVGARKECPLVVGVGDGETFIASAIPAFLQHTRRVGIVHDDELIVIRPDGAQFLDAVSGEPVTREISEVDWDDDAAEKGGFETFMLKEIHEQPAALRQTLAGRIGEAAADLSEIGLSAAELQGLKRVTIVACGTSYHAGLAARYAIEDWARLPVDVEVASEYRYRAPLIDGDSLVIGVSQSGETADTLAALRLARVRGARVVAVTNVPGSQATREADGVLFTRAGIEIGVAATKTFVSQVAALQALALTLATTRGSLDPGRLADLAASLERLPDLVEDAIRSLEAPIRTLAEGLSDAPFFLYLGRNMGLPVALEGALKLKEISYIPTDAYAAGEMKHGPIALIGEGTPVVCVATDSPVLDKVRSNIAEVAARGARVIVVATEGRKEIAEHADEVIYVPPTDPLLAPALAVIPLQLLAYGIARARGLNVDQPRNLAKTVTVE